jgi:DNA polymerase I-like protein with 3'-5' exonuclease and polymerase domains
MIEYVTDKTKDMHRDCAMDIWTLPAEEITKDIRFYAKNNWTFPQFYGSWYGSCAKNLWKNCYNLRTKSGILISDHLKSMKIYRYGDFENHCKDVETEFWGVRFKVYKKWKEDIYKFYLKHGYIETHLGFMFQGYMRKNDVTNYQTQGTAFHCLLWTLHELNGYFFTGSLKSKIIGQIHDSILIDMVPSEQEYIANTINEIVTKDIKDEFKWLNIPLTIEYEITEIDGAWNTKKDIPYKELCNAITHN